MKKLLSILLTVIMIVGMIPMSMIPALAASTTDASFTDNYELLEYIENTNGQYINTGYKAGADVTVSMNLEITSWGNKNWSSIFGSRSGNHSTNSFVMCENGSNNGERTEIGNQNYTYPNVRQYCRSNLSLSGNSNFKGSGLDIFLFGLNVGGAFDTKYGVAVYRLYSCKITDNGEVKRDFVPAQRNSDGAVGLYDLQNEKFYESANGVGFEPSMPSLWIDSGYLPTIWGVELLTSAYTVTESCTIDERVEVKGDVTLTLNDGVELTLPKGIRLTEGNSLTVNVHSQGENMGKLTATGTDGNAAIGGNAGAGNPSWAQGNAGDACGTLTVNGGVITAKGLGNSHGFGGGHGGPVYYDLGTGGRGGAGGQFLINSGVCIFSSDSGAAIGGGTGGSGDYKGADGSATKLTLGTNIKVGAGTDAYHITDTKYTSQSYVKFGEPVTVTFKIAGRDFSETGTKGLPISDPLMIDGTNNAIWYTDADRTEAYDFSKPVTGNMTLYGAWTPSPYVYQHTFTDANGVEITVSHTFSPNDPHIIRPGNLPTTWGTDNGNTWYLVEESCTIKNRIEIKGDVNLILADGVELILPKGIYLMAGNSLTVDAQFQGENMGKLTATGTDGNAAIGGNAGLGSPSWAQGNAGDACGTLTVNGGVITAKGLGDSRGFGGGHGGIANPYDYESGGSCGVGGRGGAGGQLTINGGDCTFSSESGTAIGGGTGGSAYWSGKTGAATELEASTKIVTLAGKDAANVAYTKYTDQSYAKFGVSVTVTFTIAGQDFSEIVVKRLPISDPLMIDGTNCAIWYTDADRTEAYDFSKPVTEDMTLYGAWTPSPHVYQYKRLDANGEEKTESHTFSLNDPHIIRTDNLPTKWGTDNGNTWYMVTESCTIKNRIEIKGDVNLILADGAELILPKGIHLVAGNSLTVYAQSQGENMGKLTATGIDGNAAIGGNAGSGGQYWSQGNDGDACGTLTVNGGVITAKGLGDSRGFGGGHGGIANTYTYSSGGNGGDGGQLTIFDGVCIFSSESGAAVGGGTGGLAHWSGWTGAATKLELGRMIRVRAGTDASAADKQYSGQSYAKFINIVYLMPEGSNLISNLIEIGTFEKGAVSADAEYAVENEVVTLTVTPDNYYELKANSLKVNNGAVTLTKVNESTYTFIMPDKKVTVTAEFDLPTVEIGTADELIAFANDVNSGKYDGGVNAKLTDGLGKGYANYVNIPAPIGTSEHPFRGTFDGQGYFIVYKYANYDEKLDAYGLFGVNEGTIKNLSAGDPDNYMSVCWCGKDNVGGLCGINYGTIDHCTTYLSMDGRKNVGGICGVNYGTVINCITKNAGFDVTSFYLATGGNCGGIVGDVRNGGKVYNCVNLCGVTASDICGGIAGHVEENGTVIGCFSAGTVTDDFDDGKNFASGAFGKLDSGAIIKNNYYEAKDGVPEDANATALQNNRYAAGYLNDSADELVKEGIPVITWYCDPETAYPAYEGDLAVRSVTDIIYYTLDENGVLTLNCEREVLEFPEYFFKGRTDIREVVCTGYLRDVGKGAFENCTNLTKVTINGYRDGYFEADCFAGCVNLHEIDCQTKNWTYFVASSLGSAGADLIETVMKDGTKKEYRSTAEMGSGIGNSGFQTIYLHHTDKARDVVTAPACTAEGYTTHYCRDCDYSYTDTVTEATGHHYTQKRLADKVVAPTCTEKGSIIHYCDDCDYSYTEATAAATGHYFDKNGKCTKCSQDYSTMVFGKNETVHFDGAKQVILFITFNRDSGWRSLDNIIRGDNYEQSFDLMGGIQKVFKVDGDWLSYELTSNANHTIEMIPVYDDNITTVEPACTEDGYTRYTYCDKTYQEAIPATGHHYTGKRLADEVVAPTCTEKGSIIHYCDDCDYSYMEVTDAATGHHYTGKRLADKVVAPTCTEKGGIIHYCDDCDYAYTEKTAATGHYFDKNGKCTKCSKDYSTMVFGQSETVHFEGAKQIYLTITANFSSSTNTYGNILRGSNCDQQFDLRGGKTTKFVVDGDWLSYSLNAGFTYETTVIPVYDDNITTVEPTCTKEGYTEITYCGKTYRETLPATGHYFDKNGKCTECGALYPAESNDPSDTASVLSDGNLWIILAVAVLAIGGIAALFIVKKKKKLAAAGVAADEEE